MGTRKVEVRFCDCCGKQIEGRLTLHTCPCCYKDICVSCQLREDKKHKPKERKPKPTAEELATTIINKVMPEPARQPPKRTRKAKKTTTSPLGKPDISTFSVVVGQKDELHRVCMGAQVVGCKTLKEGVTNLLAKWGIDQKYVEDAPDSEGKRNLLDILKERR